jgi:cytochrome P450
MTDTPFFAAPTVHAVSWDIDPYSPEVLSDLESWYRALRERGRVVWLSRYGCWAIGGYDEVRSVFGDAERFCSSRGVGLADFSKEVPWQPPAVSPRRSPTRSSRKCVRR